MTESLIKIDNWEIIYSTTLLMKEGQEAKIILTPEEPLIVKIKFATTLEVNNENNKKGALLQIVGEGNEGSIFLTNWDTHLGASMNEPIEFAHDDQNNQIAVLCTARFVGGIYQASFQFMRRPG